MNKQKILFIRPSMGHGGADRVTWQLLQHLDRTKYTADLAVAQAKGPFMANLPEDVVVHDFKVGGILKMIMPLYRLLRSSKYDILYSTSGGTNMVVGLLMILLGGPRKVILSERNILPPAYKGKLRRRLMLVIKRITYRSADWVTTVSAGIADELHTTIGVARAKLRVVHNPLIDEQLEKAKVLPVDHPFFAAGRDVILAAGRFVKQKDYFTLLRAFKELTEHLPEKDLGLVVLGNGPLQAAVMEQVQADGLADRVSFPGFVDNPYKYMASCKVFVLSSLHEGMPGVLVQAMACGAACVSTDCPTGPNEIIVDGQSGYLVPVGDATAIAQRTEQLLTDEPLRQRIAQAAPASVVRYHADRGIKSYFDFL